MSHEGYAVPHNSPVLRSHLELWHTTSTLKSVNICRSSFMDWHLREEVLCYLLQIWKTMKFCIQRFNVCKISFRLSKLDRTSSSWVAGKLIISFLVCVPKNTIIILTTAIAAGMDRQAMIRKWTCIFCRVMKSGSCLGWMCLPCDDLIGLGCFCSRRKPFWQSSYGCPSCGHQLPP